ncbi:beta-ketoacyl-ACP synthase III [Sedimentisphaera salicampi]|uniref:Beta-ketoacyl-[acyl-carrier-protein] synthase III n=1 Tax=Sedimentisphaera salicampi TaxID=1941349 RepID=A0A1W6LKY3_9BACT|nr:beta-ketoacyl-ACP synthase III [Sedimentisphaera salicampi]ARN56384.1 3-oxoacyl-[acyl-carrier-protein] synthase 3 [Sedimentisphaera salicampi]OXU15270.1 3-oxoacyl-[acyl-carrier-protein] synthase 3 [Sedimentisphaera salicampi]
MSNNNPKVQLPSRSAVIAGTGSALPGNILTNDDLTKIVETNDEWITTRTGIKERHIAGENETTASLAAEAARKALEQARMDPEELDLIIVATVTPEMVFPSTACFVQADLGAKNSAAYDLSAACSGFVFALMTAANCINNGALNNVLVIGAETLSKITNYKDRASCILFGDGAGAAVVKASDEQEKGILYSNMGSDGTGWTALNCQAYGSKYPADKPLEDEAKKYMFINGREVYQLAVRKIVETVEDCLDKTGLKSEDIKKVVPHQMNARIIESSAKRLGLTQDQLFVNIDKTGNTSAASIPIALDECNRAGHISEGDYVALVAFGAGLTWGGNIIKF